MATSSLKVKNAVGRLPEGATREAPEDGRFMSLPEAMNQGRELTSAKKDFSDYLYRTRKVTLFEAGEEIGGQFNNAKLIPGKADA